MERRVINNLKCSMCFFNCASQEELINHYVKNHKHDPQFRVECSLNGCGATFKKWRSFRSHLYQNHSHTLPFENEILENFMEEAEINRQDPDDIPMQLNNNEDDTGEEDFGSPLERLQWFAALFIVNIREHCKISQTAVDHIIDGVTNLVDVYSTIVIKELRSRQNPETQELNFADVQKLYNKEYPPSIIFSSVRSKEALDDILTVKFNMVSAETHSMATGLQWKKIKRGTQNIPRICEVSYDAYIVPFLDNLRNLLNNQQVRENVENPRQHEANIFRTVLDGSYYLESDLYQQHNNALAIIFYYDDLCIANSVGSASKKHKMSMFYWTLANIYPEYRSSTNVIQLYAIVKTEYLKKPGSLQKILEPFILGIQELQRDGININVGGEIKNFKGFLLFCSGDTPASSLLGGFKESVSAYRFCRSCLTTRDEWKRSFRNADFQPRNKIMHANHLEAITDSTITSTATAFWQKAYGINKSSPLIDIIDVTKCFPQDAMHVLIEGPLQITCKLFLKYCIYERELFTIDELNNRIRNFNFGHLRRDKPASIEREHLANDGQLRQTAAQMITLAHTLLFLIGEWILELEDENLTEHIHCFVTLLQVMNVCLAYEIKSESVQLLERMIEVYILNFRGLYSNEYLIPKFHLIIHIPQYIRMFGPARQQWCFRFEATHAYFKSLVPVVKNFKNTTLTLSYRHQARLCSRLASLPGMPSRKFLYEGDDVSSGEKVLLNSLPYSRIFDEIIVEPDCYMMRSAKLIINGTVYRANSIVLLTCDEDDLPIFGEVEDIFVVENKKLLVISILQTVRFEFKLNSYYIQKQWISEKLVKNVEELIFPHPLSSFSVINKKYIPLIDHDRVEFY